MKIESRIGDPRNKMMDEMRELAQSTQVDSINNVLEKLNEFMPMTGNDALSALTTYLSYFIVRSIVFMKEQVADKDETGCTLQETFNTVFYSCAYILKLDHEVKKMPNNIKKITY